MIPFLSAGHRGRSVLRAAILGACLVVLQSAAGQPCVMWAPNEPVPVSLSAACDDVLTPGLLGVEIACPGDLQVTILDNGVPIGDHITSAMIGNTYMAIVEHLPTGQSVMPWFTVLDKLPPVANCPGDITLACNADLDAYVGLTEDDVEDCSPVTIYRDDVLVSTGDCDGAFYTEYHRTYIIVDDYNNADTCEQGIFLVKATLDQVDFPADLAGPTALSCFPAPDTTPVGTGYPSINGVPIANGAFCNLAATHTDFIFPVCSGSYKIQRTWRILDWCQPGVFRDSIQLIEVLDMTPPVVTAPADITISTDPGTCTGSYLLPEALVSEDCSTSWFVRTTGPFGTMNTNGGPISGLPVGDHLIHYTARTDCGLEGSDILKITVVDLVPPTTVCHGTATIPVNNEGITVIPASVFNSGSYDNCGDVYFKVRRMTAPAGYTCANPGNPTNQFDDFVQFCCADIANNNILVILRVYDVPPGPGPVSDTHLAGHFSECMVQVEVQDKLPPQLTCPSNLTISCEFPFTEENLDVFGTVALSEAAREDICLNDPGSPAPGVECLGVDGLVTDNCTGVNVTSTAVVNVNNCGLGSIVRTFTATDAGGLQAVCQQIITIVNFYPFTEGDIIWPEDFTTTNLCEVAALDPEDLEAPYNYPVLADGPCDLVAATHKDLVFDLTNDDQACFKILRTWTVIDWCQLNTPAGGQWTHLQVIKVMNNVAPVIEPLADRTECSEEDDCNGIPLSFEAFASDDCSSAVSLRWRYFVDEGNDGVVEDISGIQPGGSVSFERYMPLGTHRIIFTVWDQCGNTATEEQLVTVENCIGPSAKCIHGLSTNLMPMDTDGDGQPDWGMVNVRAEMFDAGSDQLCGNPITFSFTSDSTVVSRTFDCTLKGLREIEVWVTDQVTGLTDFCLTTLDVQDNDGVCPSGLGGAGTISGSIRVPGAGQLGGASVHLDGSGLGDATTTADGYFSFPPMSFGGSYVVRPERNDDHKNGITTIDLVHIQKHLLGIETFTQPYQYIAADANNSGSVSAIDILEVRKLILGLSDVFSNNTSWRFIDRGHLFPDPNNPWSVPWPETYTIQPFATSMNEVDFDAVKVGDLNRSASLRANGAMILPRSQDRARVDYTVKPVSGADDLIEVAVYLDQADRFQAIQFSYGWDQSMFELVNGMTGPDLQPEDLRLPETSADQGALAAYRLDGWDKSRLLLFTLTLKARYPAPFNLFLAQQPAPALAYALEDEEEMSVFIDSPAKAQAQVQNRPNPFREMTIIEFDSRSAGPGTLRITDMNGRLVLKRALLLVKGANEFAVRRAELGGAGLYQYEIETDNQFTSNRMIIVD